MDWTESGNVQVSRIEDFLSAHYVSKSKYFSVIWAAGLAGFGSAAEDTQKEEAHFATVLDFFASVGPALNEPKIKFVLISTIGGLFEGQSSISSTSVPAPIRPYGVLKRNQERMLNTRPGLSPVVFRLPSVYSYINTSRRMGLIQTMLLNGLRRQSTSIFGSPFTLRDYIWADDVGRSVRLAIEAEHLESTLYHLVSGNPTSILEIKSVIERALHRPIMVSFRFEKTNGLNITCQNHGYDGLWRPTKIDENIQKIIEQTKVSIKA